MTEEIKYKRKGFDLEAGSSRRDYPEDEDDASNPFDIVRTKSAPVHRLRRWRVSRRVLSDLILWFFVVVALCFFAFVFVILLHLMCFQCRSL